jgi:predicted ester cyclase
MKSKIQMAAMTGSCAVAILVVGCAASRLEQNKQVVLAQARAYNARDVDGFRATVTPDLRRHCQATPDIDVRSADEFVAFAESDWQTFPDGRLEVDRLVAEGELVGVFGRYSGTQVGAMGPFPASGKRTELDFGGVFRIEKNKIAEIWITWDNLTALTQLGHWPPGTSVTGSQDRTSP